VSALDKSEHFVQKRIKGIDCWFSSLFEMISPPLQSIETIESVGLLT